MKLSLISESMGHLLLTDTGIVEIPSLGLPLNKLESLNHGGFFEGLPHSLVQVVDLWDLRKLTLDFFTPRFGLECLKELRLSGSNIESLPTAIRHVSALTHLYLRDCKMLRFLPELPPCTSLLDVSNCMSLEGASISNVSDYPDSHYQGYFLFRNCFKLNEQTLNIIMSDAHVMMMRASYIKHLQPYEWAKARMYGKVHAFWLPVSKIPADRYHYRKTTEDSMTIQLCSLSNLVGFICCIVFSRCQLGGEFKFIVGFRCYLQTSNGEKVELKCCFNDFCYERAIQNDSHHVLLWQDEQFCERLINEIKSNEDDSSTTYNPKLSLQIFFLEDCYSTEEKDLDSETKKHENEKQIKIKEWGICPVYVSDLFNFREQLALDANIKRARDTDEFLDRELLPPSKKLKTEWKKGPELLEPTTDNLFVIFLKHLWRLVSGLLMLRFLIKKYKEIVSWDSKEKEE